MYKIVSDTGLVAICEDLRFVRKKASTGAWIQSDEAEAQAIAVRGELYGFGDHEVEDRPTVTIMKIDGGEWVADTYVEENAYKTDIAALEDALCEMDSAGS